MDSRTGREIWRFATGEEVKSSPAIANDTIYFGSFDARLYALDVITGLEKWRFRTLSNVFSSPVIGDGIIFFGSDDGHVYALE